MSGPHIYYNSCMSILQTIVTAGCTLLATIIGLAAPTVTKMLENRQVEKQEQRNNLINRSEKYVNLCFDIYQSSKHLIEIYQEFPPLDESGSLPVNGAELIRQLDEDATEVERDIDRAKGIATKNTVILIAERPELKEPVKKLIEAADFLNTLGITDETVITDNFVADADARYKKSVAEVTDALGKFIK